MSENEISKVLLETLDLVDDHVVRDIVVGKHLVAVSSYRVGLAATVDPQGGHLRNMPDPCKWVNYIGRGAKELAFKLLSADTFQSSLGLAAVNSLIPDNGNYLHGVKAQDIFVKKGRGGTVQ